MGQIANAVEEPLLLSDVDRLNTSNAGAGLSPSASHVILLGANAGDNLSRSDIIAIGFEVFSGGGAGVSSTSANGSVAIGEQSTFGDIVTFTGSDTIPTAINGPITAYGSKLFPLMPRMASSVVIGYNIAPLVASNVSNNAGNIYIGHNIFQNCTAMSNGATSENIVIGVNAFRGSAGDRKPSSDIIIGYQAFNVATTPANNVAIGSRVGGNLTTAQDNVIIGRAAGVNLTSGPKNVLIGSQAAVNTGAAEENVTIGESSMATGSWNVCIGAQIGAGVSIPTGTDASIWIGAQINGTNIPANIAQQLLIENANGVGSRRSIIYGQLLQSNLVLGHSSLSSREFGGTGATNVVKLMNGTKGNAAPTGGGYLYATGGALRWIDTANTETPLGPAPQSTVALLPVAGWSVGARFMVTDALAPAFGAVVAGGGAVVTPVYWNGANWIVG